MQPLSRTELINRRVVFGVSDPWDFASENGEGQFSATVVAAQEKALAIKLDKPLSFEGMCFDHLVVTARHVSKELPTLAQKAIPVNLTPIPSGILNSTRPEALFIAAENWRGWHLIGSLRIE